MGLPGGPSAADSDGVRPNGVAVDLDIDGITGPNHEVEEDDPGGFIALGGARKKILLSATPNDLGPLTLEVTAGGDKVDIYAAQTGGDPLTGADLT